MDTELAGRAGLKLSLRGEAKRQSPALPDGPRPLGWWRWVLRVSCAWPASPASWRTPWQHLEQDWLLRRLRGSWEHTWALKLFWPQHARRGEAVLFPKRTVSGSVHLPAGCITCTQEMCFWFLVLMTALRRSQPPSPFIHSLFRQHARPEGQARPAEAQGRQEAPAAGCLGPEMGTAHSTASGLVEQGLASRP